MWRSVSHPWLLTPKQCVACVSMGTVTKRVADWQTNISIPNSGQRNADQPSPQPATRRMSLFARQIHFFVLKGELCLTTESSAASARRRTGCVITCLMSDALQGYCFIFLHHLGLSHTLPSNVSYSRHKCWNGRRWGGEGRWGEGRGGAR